jgi:hypothetical protein
MTTDHHRSDRKAVITEHVQAVVLDHSPATLGDSGIRVEDARTTRVPKKKAPSFSVLLEEHSV